MIDALEAEGTEVNKRSFTEKYLEVCKERGLKPRFSQFLDTVDGEYVYTDGYYKLPVDFKTFANDEAGTYLPQGQMTPDFDTDYMTQIMEKYAQQKGIDDAELNEKMPGVVERITEEIVKPGSVKLSERSDEKKSDIRFSTRQIVGESGTNYGVGVYLDSESLSGLSDDKRKDTARNYIKSLSGQVFSAVSPDGKTVPVMIAPSDQKYRKENGKRVPVSKDMLNFLNDKTKQEALVLVDELIETARYKESEVALHKHDWVDNNGKNKWDLWKTYLLDKNNTIWEASLRVANSANGEKILFDVFPIEEKEASQTMATPSDKNNTTDAGKSQGQKSASMTESRIDYLIEDSGAGKRTDYARKWITAISPTDFINLTTKTLTDRSAFDATPTEYGSTMDSYDYKAELQNNMRQTPYLAVDVNTGEVVGHEGRHRMRALEREGVRSVPVAIEFRDENGYVLKEKNGYGNPLETLPAFLLKNQFGSGFETDVENVIPLMQAKRDEIISAYGSEDAGFRYSDRNPSVPDARTLLANALTDAAQNDLERERLEKYQEKIGEMNAEQDRLNELNAQIKELSFAKGKRDTARIRDLRDEAIKAKNRINIYDKQLLRMEASKPLERVLQVEKDKAVLRERAKAREKMREEKRAAASRLDAAVRYSCIILAAYMESSSENFA